MPIRTSAMRTACSLVKPAAGLTRTMGSSALGSSTSASAYTYSLPPPLTTSAEKLAGAPSLA